MINTFHLDSTLLVFYDAFPLTQDVTIDQLKQSGISIPRPHDNENPRVRFFLWPEAAWQV